MKLRGRKSSMTVNQPQTEEAIQLEILLKAYELFESRGGSHGNHVEDWLEAEREVLTRLNAGSDTKVRPLTPRRTARKRSVKSPS